MTPEAKKALYKQPWQPFPEETVERTDGGHSTTSVADARACREAGVAGPRGGPGPAEHPFVRPSPC